MVPKHTIYCLGEVLLALDAGRPAGLTRKAFGLASAGMPPCWHRPVPRRAGAPLFWPSWERTHSGSGPPPRSPPRAWIPHTRAFPAHCPPLCCLRPTARRSLTARAPPAAVCPGAAGAGALPARGRPALCLLRPMRQPAAVHPFSGPHRRPGCRGPDLLCALSGACPLAPAGGRSGPAGGHAAAAPPGRHCPSHHGRAGIFVRHGGDAGGAFPSPAGAHPAGAFGPRRGHPRLYPHEPCILAGALPPCPAAGRQGALLFAAKKQHAGKTAPPHHQQLQTIL